MNIPWILVLIFALLSIPLLMGKGGYLLAGFNTLNKNKKEEFKAKFNLRKICRAMGIMLLLMDVIIITVGIVDNAQFAKYALIFMVIVIISILLYANIGCKRE